MKKIITLLIVVMVSIIATIAPYNANAKAFTSPPPDSVILLKIYPNPVINDYITISLPSDVITENAMVYMYDEQGRMILAHNFPVDGRIPLVGITKGPLRFAVYYIRVVTADGSQYAGPFVRAAR